MPPRRGRPVGRGARPALPATPLVPDPPREPETLGVPEAAFSTRAPPVAPTRPAALAEVPPPSLEAFRQVYEWYTSHGIQMPPPPPPPLPLPLGKQQQEAEPAASTEPAERERETKC